MLATKHTQSLTDFRQRSTETLDRLNKTGQAEIITVNGEARAVLLSPAAYDDLAKDAQVSRDVMAIRRSLQEISVGKFKEADQFFTELRAGLLKMKAARK